MGCVEQYKTHGNCLAKMHNEIIINLKDIVVICIFSRLVGNEMESNIYNI